MEGLFTNMKVEGMLEDKHYQCVHMVLLFLAVYIDRPTGPLRDSSTSVLHKKNSELVLKRIKEWNDEEMSFETMINVS